MAPRVVVHPGARTKEATSLIGRSLAHLTHPVPKETRPPKLYPCSGCGGKFPARKLIELHEDNHDNLTYFHGDLLCAECANAAGVIL